MVEIKHCCMGAEGNACHHPVLLSKAIKRFVEKIDGFNYRGTFGEKNSQSRNMEELDRELEKRMSKHGFESLPKPEKNELGNIKPDIFFQYKTDRCKIAVEIKKANHKSIWFDIIKILSLIKNRTANYGFILAPEKSPHRNGCGELYKYACKAKSSLRLYAEAPTKLFRKYCYYRLCRTGTRQREMDKIRQGRV